MHAARLALIGCIGLGTHAVAADESDYVLVRAFPPIRGTLVETMQAEDPAGQRWLVRRVYELPETQGIYVTIVREVHCGAEPAGDRPGVPHIQAVQFRPKAPKTFAEATVHDIFLEVYVADPEGNIRRYDHLGAQAIAEMSEKPRPTCAAI